MSRHPPPEKQSPRQDDRHHLTGAKQRRFIEANRTFVNTENPQIVKTKYEAAAETAMSAALREAVPDALQVSRIVRLYAVTFATAATIARLAYAVAL